MSTACITKVYSYKSYKCDTPNQSSTLNSCRTLNGPKMAPLVDQEKNPGTDIVVENSDEQYTSTETNSSDDNSDVQLYEGNLNRLRNLPLNDSPAYVNESINRDLRGPSLVNTYGAYDLSVTSEMNGLYNCRKCDFVGRNDDQLHDHCLIHDPYECASCGLLAENGHIIEKHLQDEHKNIRAADRGENILFHGPPESISEPVKSETKKKKVNGFEDIDRPRKTRCSKCNALTNSKREYYDHVRELHKKENLIYCKRCEFVCFFKHHFNYHDSNHTGSKPFACQYDGCTYECVNKSMLNSHLKSHSQIFQYSCSNCTYQTKYLHSLKMHLRKYDHKPGRTLNPDGSVNTDSVIDVNGKRRGPKGKKRKSEADKIQESNKSPKSKSSQSSPSPYFEPPSQDIRILFNPQFHNNYMGNMYVRVGTSDPTNHVLHSPPINEGQSYRCSYCTFVTENEGLYNYHVQDHMYALFRSSIDRARSQFDSELFYRQYIANLRPTIEMENTNESRNMDHFQNSANNYETMEHSGENEKEWPWWRPKLHTPFSNPPYSTLTVKKEIPEPMNGIESRVTKNPTNNGALDLSVKQPTSPVMKSKETLPTLRRNLEALSFSTTANHAYSASPAFRNEESKATNPRRNRRKGIAHHLKRYVMESDPVSGAAETESGKMGGWSNEARSKPSFGSEIKNSVPRIWERKCSKPTPHTTKLNGFNSHQPTHPQFDQCVPQAYHHSIYAEPTYADPEADRKALSGGDFWCQFCKQNQLDPYLQKIHLSFHSKDDPFTCAKCGLRCDNAVNFIKHIMAGSRINGTCINAIEKK